MAAPFGVPTGSDEGSPARGAVSVVEPGRSDRCGVAALITVPSQ